MEISTSFCFLIALLTLNPNYKMNMFCYKEAKGNNEIIQDGYTCFLQPTSLYSCQILQKCTCLRLQNCNHLPLMRIPTSPSLLPNSEPLFLIHSHLYRTITLVGLVTIYYFTTY